MNWSDPTVINVTLVSTTKSLVNASMRLTTTQSPGWLEYQAFEQAFYRSVICIRLPVSIFGVITSILLTATLFRNKALNAPCFYCYQGMSVASGCYAFLEVLNLLYKVGVAFKFSTLRWLMGESVIFAWALPANPVPFLNVFNLISYDIQAILIAFLSFHRGMACFFMNGFKILDRDWVCLGVTFGICAFFLCLGAPWFYTATLPVGDPVRVAYNYVKDHAMPSIVMVAVVTTSTFAVAGLVRVFFHRRRLFAKIHPNQVLTPGQIELLKAAKKNLWLCFLQISQALPITIQCILMATRGDSDALETPAQHGTSDLDYAYKWTIAERGRGLMLSASTDLHFVFFLIFAASFRKAFKERFLRKPHCCR